MSHVGSPYTVGGGKCSRGFHVAGTKITKSLTCTNTQHDNHTLLQTYVLLDNPTTTSYNVVRRAARRKQSSSLRRHLARAARLYTNKQRKARRPGCVRNAANTTAATSTTTATMAKRKPAVRQPGWERLPLCVLCGRDASVHLPDATWLCWNCWDARQAEAHELW